MQSVVVQMQIAKMLNSNGLYLVLNFVGIVFSINQGKTTSTSYNVYSNPNIFCT